MAATRRLTELVEAVMPRLDPPHQGVVALSGGADSATLAYLLGAGARRALHVHHGLAWSDRLAEAAARVASSLSLPLEVIRVAVPPGPSPEGQARAVRYAALHEALEEGEILLTAHTRDDQAETVLMALLRGSGPAGLAGIPPLIPGRVARPLLRVARAETREIAVLAGLPFFDDPSNTDPGLLRNRIRLELLPALRAGFNARIDEALVRSAALLAADNDHLERLASAAVPVRLGAGVALIPLGALRAAPRVLGDRALRQALAAIRPPHPPGHDELARVRSVADGAATRAELSGGVTATRQAAMLALRVGATPASAPGPVPLMVGGNRLGGLLILVEEVDRPCRAAPMGPARAIFPLGTALVAVVDAAGEVTVTADGEPAWVPGVRRLPVAWYQPGASGYLSLSAGEES